MPTLAPFHASRQARLLKFGGGGHTIEYPSRREGELQYGRSSLSGYERPETWTNRPDDHVPDGCAVLDVRQAIETPEGFSWVFKGPMCDVDLSPGAMEPCPDLTDSLMVRAMLTDPGNRYGSLAAIQLAHTMAEKPEPGPLDHVDIATYLDGWRRHGARTGRIVDGRIIWDEGVAS